MSASKTQTAFERLLDEAVARLSGARYTFTEAYALRDVWGAGYEATPEADPRFVAVPALSRSGEPQWRLASQTLANDRLLDELRSGAWDGHRLEAELARLSAEDDRAYVFCPSDDRFARRPHGVWEASVVERDVVVPASVAGELDALRPTLAERWCDSGSEPWTVRRIAQTLSGLGWSDTDAPGAIQLVAAWLRHADWAVRVGQDLWALADSVPTPATRQTMRVAPIFTPPSGTRSDTSSYEAGDRNVSDSDEGGSGKGGRGTLWVDAQSALPAPTDPSTLLWSDDQAADGVVTWTVPLRTSDILNGCLKVPKHARCAYPPRPLGASSIAVLRGKWFDSAADVTLWLDRDRDLLYGPDLADLLAWCSTGEKLYIQWTPDVIVLRTAGTDEDVQREETRLVDPDELRALRGGLGESYRASMQAILEAELDGLTFRELMDRLCERQGHHVHRGTVRAILHASGFIRRDDRWIAAPDTARGARRLRAAVVESRSPGSVRSEQEPESSMDRMHRIATTIRWRLHEIVAELGSGAD